MMGPIDMLTNPTLLQFKVVRLSQSFYSVIQYLQNVKKNKRNANLNKKKQKIYNKEKTSFTILIFFKNYFKVYIFSFL